MRADSIRAHLKTYSIYQKRKTTINHAFASALAPKSAYSPITVAEALRALGQSAEYDLVCVYCGGEAQTWDHLSALVKDSELAGFGHQVGNLVPCCRHCNSRKGSKDWQRFVQEEVEEPRRSELISALVEYQRKFATPIDLRLARARNPEGWQRYDALRAQIHQLMQEADSVAETLRSTVRARAVANDALC